ncbi:MAG TPA: DoxX family protein [Alcanivoracaceae bacterium]|nr:DoxX family protein [Alcanivoracaceae bacterium]
MKTNTDLGLLILRLTLAVIMLPHGLDKVLGGVGYIESVLAQHNLPTVLAYGVYIGEVVAPMMLMVGYYSRIAALLIAGNMVVAIALVHASQILSFGGGFWQIELQALMLAAAVTLALTGPGRHTWRH